MTTSRRYNHDKRDTLYNSQIGHDSFWWTRIHYWTYLNWYINTSIILKILVTSKHLVFCNWEMWVGGRYCKFTNLKQSIVYCGRLKIEIWATLVVMIHLFRCQWMSPKRWPFRLIEGHKKIFSFIFTATGTLNLLPIYLCENIIFCPIWIGL